MTPDDEAARIARARKTLPKRVGITDLCRALGVQSRAWAYQVERGHATKAGADRKFDRDRALTEWANRPRRRTAEPIPGRERVVGAGTEPQDTSGFDPDTRYRLAKAQQEEIKLARLREESLDAKVVERRVFALFHMVRDRMQSWVSRAAPAIGARLTYHEGVAEQGSLWRALDGEVRKLLEELAGLDLSQAVKMDLEEEAPPPEEEPEDLPKKRGRPRKTP